MTDHFNSMSRSPSFSNSNDSSSDSSLLYDLLVSYFIFYDIEVPRANVLLGSLVINSGEGDNLSVKTYTVLVSSGDEIFDLRTVKHGSHVNKMKDIIKLRKDIASNCIVLLFVCAS